METEKLIKETEEQLLLDQGKQESVRNMRELLSAELSSMQIRFAELLKDREAAEREMKTLKEGAFSFKEHRLELDKEEKRLNAVRCQKPKNVKILPRKIMTVLLVSFMKCMNLLVQKLRILLLR